LDWNFFAVCDRRTNGSASAKLPGTSPSDLELFRSLLIMKDLVILVLVIIVGFLVWNSRVTVSGYTPPVETSTNVPVPPDVIQAILEKIQQTKPDEYPLETLFITPQADGVYTSRFMFFNTRKFFGNQYDVIAKVADDGTVEIQKMTEFSKPDPGTGYKPDTYKPYEDIQNNATSQLRAVLATRPETPVVTDMTLGTRA